MRNDFALILPYYGRLPWYFNYYLKSLDGRSLDVIFVSDLDVREHPENFKPLYMSFEELNERIIARIPGARRLENTRKLCDFKPMYGKIFEEELSEYSYWAFGDCDLVYGRALDDFLVRVHEVGYDFVSLRKHWTSGSLCLVRNTRKMRDLYQKSTALEEVFSASDCVCFDELGGYWFFELEDARMTMTDCEKLKDYFAAVVWRQNDLQFSHEDVMEECSLAHEKVEMRNHRLLFADRELVAFHFINAKRNPAFKANGCVNYAAIGDYVITKAGMFHSVLGRSGWRFLWVFRATIAHWRGYAQYVHERGCVCLMGHFIRRILKGEHD